jgi:conjugative transfer signal peptidase TraF
LFATGATVLAALAMADVAGLRINLTPSMPIGLWAIATIRGAPTRGDTVAACLPGDMMPREAMRRGYVAAGSCRDGTEPLVKPVMAIAGDLVTVSPGGISVNTKPIATTTPLDRDEAGRPLRAMPIGSYRVPRDELWVLSGHDPWSYDSRYFGAVPLSNVIGIARPLWVSR